MDHDRNLIIRQAELAEQVPIYEIRVRGRLDSDRWAHWFDAMTIVVLDSGDTVLQGPIPDQAALYGLLARLRDLALPVVALNRLEPDEEKEYSSMRFYLKERPSLRINLLLAALMLLVAAGLSTLTVYLTSEAGVHTALALTALFAGLAGTAFACWRVGGGWWWRLLTGVTGLAALITGALYVILAGWVSLPLALAALSFLAAGGVLLILARTRSAGARAIRASVRWDRLGAPRHDAIRHPAERDVSPVNRDRRDR